jgi:hypothetical protein
MLIPEMVKGAEDGTYKIKQKWVIHTILMLVMVELL